jgi:hypothetical protein
MRNSDVNDLDPVLVDQLQLSPLHANFVVNELVKGDCAAENLAQRNLFALHEFLQRGHVCLTQIDVQSGHRFAPRPFQLRPDPLNVAGNAMPTP